MTSERWLFFGRIDILCIKTKEAVRNMLFGERKTHPRMFTTNYYWRWWEFGISGFGTTTTKVVMENMSGQLY